MPLSFDPGALLARSYELPRGPRVCLRLVRSRDWAGVEALLDKAGVSASQIDIARLVRSDPRRTVVITATALVDGSERVVGLGALAVDGVEPSLLVVDTELTEGLDELLGDALAGRARALVRRRAA